MNRGKAGSDALLSDDRILKSAGYKIRYHPYGASRELFTVKDDEVLIVGPKGTGKSLSALHKVHLVLGKYAGARGFMSRKTRTSMTNACLKDFQDKILKPPDKVHFHKQDQVFNYPNGSMFAVIGLDDVQRLNSSEWDIGYIQEATEVTENDWETAGACIRHGVVPYQQLIGDANPDKPTHWLKVRCDKGLTKMLKSYHEDNPKFYDHVQMIWTPEGYRYIEKLKRLSGVRYKRLYEGEWAAAEGIVYEEWDTKTHLINRSDLPAHWDEWPHYWAIDFGYTHPFVWQDWMEAPNGDLILNREIYRTRVLVEDVARRIKDLNSGFPAPRAIICDHDAEGRKVFERHTGYLTLPAYKDIQVGVQGVKRRLSSHWHEDDAIDPCLRPGIFLLRDALLDEDEELKDAGKPYSTEGEFDGYVWDEKYNATKANSKKDEIPKDQDNHGMDATRYIVAFIDSLADDPEEFEGIISDEETLVISPY